MERFSENFDQEGVTYLIFSLEQTDFKNVIFEKIPLSKFSLNLSTEEVWGSKLLQGYFLCYLVFSFKNSLPIDVW